MPDSSHNISTINTMYSQSPISYIPYPISYIEKKVTIQHHQIPSTMEHGFYGLTPIEMELYIKGSSENTKNVFARKALLNQSVH